LSFWARPATRFVRWNHATDETRSAYGFSACVESATQNRRWGSVSFRRVRLTFAFLLHSQALADSVRKPTLSLFQAGLRVVPDPSVARAPSSCSCPGLH
jgi:hypothetical protein